MKKSRMNLAFETARLEFGNHVGKLIDKKTKVLFQGEYPRLNSPVFIMSETSGEYSIPAPEGVLKLADGRNTRIDKNSLFNGWVTAEAEALKMAVERKVRKEIRATLSKPRRKTIKFS